MTSKIEINIIDDLLIKKSIYEKQQENFYDESDRMLRIEIPNQYDYDRVSKERLKEKEKSRVIIIDI
tara:strand:- start:297 stop:497 length:201 start_codon:yes stop_codon:yes gene_type:complete